MTVSGTAESNGHRPIGMLRVLVETYYDVQDQRIRSSHRINKYSKTSEAVPEELSEWHNEVDKRMKRSEDFLKRKVMKIISPEPLWTSWLESVSGIGPCLCGGLLGWINIETCKTVSGLWKYAGQSVVNGEAERRRKGHKLGYNPKLKTLCWKVGESFVKQKPEKVYRIEYDRFRKQVQRKIDDNGGKCHKFPHKNKKGQLINEGLCTDAHIYAMSKRLTVKLFLSHLWVTWRGLERLSVENPFVFTTTSTNEAHDIEHYIKPLRDK